jgi:hypothetical protein
MRSLRFRHFGDAHVVLKLMRQFGNAGLVEIRRFVLGFALGSCMMDGACTGVRSCGGAGAWGGTLPVEGRAHDDVGVGIDLADSGGGLRRPRKG